VTLSPDQVKRAYIATLQRDLNTHLRRLHSPVTLPVDGEWDPATEQAFHDVCQVLGLAPEQKIRTFRIISGAAAARTPVERATAKTKGTAHATKLKAGGVPPRTVARSRSLPSDERTSAYIAFLQRALNDHLVRLGSPYVLGVDGRWGKDTDLAFRRVCKVLGLAPVRNMRTYRAVAGALAARTDAELARAGGDYERRLKAFFAHEREEAAKKPPPVVKPHTKPHDSRLAQAIRAHGGRYEQEILAASHKTGAPVALLCALIEHESGFTNVYGHDGVSNPVKSVFGRPNLQVTKENYAQYKRYRNAGRGPQGVGPMQLTTPSFQDRADALGGCWVPAANIQAGAEVILSKIKNQGGGNLWRGLKAYNGSGDRAVTYANTLLAATKKWEQHLGTAGAAPASASTSAAAGPRTLRGEVSGGDVEAFQKLINHRLAAWGVHKRIAEDGAFGSETRKAAAEVAAGMGIARADFAKGFTPAVRTVMRHPDKRTGAQKARAAARKAYRARLRKTYAAPKRGDLRTLLRGHSEPKSAYLRTLIQRAPEFGLVVTSTNDGTHAATSNHYRDLAVDFGVTSDLAGTPEHTRRLKRFQEAMLKEAPHLLELFGPIRDSGVKNGRRIVIDERLWRQHLNHVHVAAN
jgi:hypothetical protein